jgi:hypothetical protein
LAWRQAVEAGRPWARFRGHLVLRAQRLSSSMISCWLV